METQHEQPKYHHYKQIINRLARIEGQVRGVKSMTEKERDCPEILLQIAAIKEALNEVEKLMLQDHLQDCMTDALHRGDEGKMLEDLSKVLNHLVL
ncbi:MULTISPECIES: metal-sensing transcriptional repressor [unclassified Sporolactobacillus]|uniref:metal-sensing transcriptional repressor n=1 Tax=unclassified Sporolactobacillus TaxID=2628533 RepID=UPI00236755C6|nr:metal-sensing transcriptional repressor [Sporolactobacillus sp. CQH2019]MDD9148586.1 metal-sensing transcriptional repressor [Sporolactobacillus sp. CQH2019]